MSALTLIAALLTLFATAMLVPALQPAARHFGLVDRPGGRRMHETATPAIGGLSILLAAAPIGLWLVQLTPGFVGVGLAAIVILIAGVADDLYRIRWQYRLCAQITAALIVIYVGGIRVENIGQVFGFVSRPLGPLSVPLTVLATVGIINAVNMADGVDGLAGTVSLVATLMLGATALYAGNVHLAEGLGLLAGGLCGFLIFNLRTPWSPKARIFLGNAGSELLGLILACGTFRLTQNVHHPVGVQVAPFLLAPFVIDCLTLMIRRIRMGVSPFLGDRNHLHHLLLDAGASVTGVVVIISTATFTIGLTAAIALKMHVPAPFFSLAFAGMWAVYFLTTGRRERSVAKLAQALNALSILRQRFAGPLVLTEASRVTVAAEPSPWMPVARPKPASSVSLDLHHSVRDVATGPAELMPMIVAANMRQDADFNARRDVRT
jgi:UDP-GlcNAc:undecaprenyl-phosphate GlcNAc-1-phosphate transferase